MQRPCLFSDVEYDLIPALKSGDDSAVKDVLLEALGAKPNDHVGIIGTERGMSAIGG